MFCFLTDSCVPIISPIQFRMFFFENYYSSFMSWKYAWWNVNFSKRANLSCLKKEFHLANTPWFILNRRHSEQCIKYSKINEVIYKIINKGVVANESIFAIMLYSMNTLDEVMNENTTLMDWSRMTSPTSPYLFKSGDYKDKKIIDNLISENKNAIFLRKIDPMFPNTLLLEYIYKDRNQNVITKMKTKLFWLEMKINGLNFFFKYYKTMIMIVFLYYYINTLFLLL